MLCLDSECALLVCPVHSSMVRAVDGMIKEKDAIFLSLIASVLLFQMETLAAGFLVMEQNAAIVCSFILFTGAYYWYKYCSRIYYRFKVGKSIARMHLPPYANPSAPSCPVLSCPVLSCPVLSCPVLSCPVLSYALDPQGPVCVERDRGGSHCGGAGPRPTAGGLQPGMHILWICNAACLPACLPACLHVGAAQGGTELSVSSSHSPI
jgi:hypothetical protein